MLLTRTVAVFSDPDKDSSCILSEEWLLLLFENMQLHYRRTVYVNVKRHQAIFILFSIFVLISLRLFICSREHN